MESVELSHGSGADSPEIVDAYPYSPINLPPAGSSIITESLKHGSNYYTSIVEQDDAPDSLNCRQLIIEALKLRCQTDEQLTRRNFVLPTQSPSEQDKVKLPLEIHLYDFVSAPPAQFQRNKRAAIAIDCEMVGVRPYRQVHHPPQSSQSTATGAQIPSKPKQQLFERSELVQLCAVDVMTGEILINELVQPAGSVVNWRVRYSGVTPAKLREAKAKGTTLPHWKAARALLLEYLDSETVLVGHSVEHDLQMLRLSHGRIVDTSMQTAAAVFGVGHVPYPRIWGLKHLTQRLTGKTIQAGSSMSRPRRAVIGHDCVEDTLASRELALWCILHPEELEVWGREMRKEIADKEAAAQRKKEEEAARVEHEEMEASNKVSPSMPPRPAN